MNDIIKGYIVVSCRALEELDATYDSDNEADYTKMDMVCNFCVLSHTLHYTHTTLHTRTHTTHTHTTHTQTDYTHMHYTIGSSYTHTHAHTHAHTQHTTVCRCIHVYYIVDINISIKVLLLHFSGEQEGSSEEMGL